MSHLNYRAVGLGLTNIFLSGVLAACASAPKADLPADINPSDEVAKLEKRIGTDYDKQLDVLAPKDFTHAQDKLAKAKREIQNSDKQQVVVETLRKSAGYLDRAEQQASAIDSRVTGILEARQAAIKAGARNYTEEASMLKSADDDLRSDLSEVKSATISPKEWSNLQEQYLTLEVKTTQTAKLSDAYGKIKGAVENGAGDYSPKSLRTAQWDFQNCRNTIATSVHDEALISKAADAANKSADQLVAVLAQTKKGRVPEDTAIKLVADDQKINSLSAKVNEVDSKESELAKKLRADQISLALDRALKNARDQFSPDEAEVYRAGNQLLLRLKGANFEVGKADLTKQSSELLMKVDKVAMSLNPEQVLVEGNTDSTGSKQTNMKLSQDRADKVANFLGQNGVPKDKVNAIANGFEKPIASNKSEEGRAQNRRVDVLITPSIPMPENVKSASGQATETEM